LVVRRLTELGLDARAFTRNRARARSLGIPDVIEGNALLPDDCLRALEGCQAVICTLGERWVPRDHRIVDGDGVINLARAAETLGARRFVLISGSMTWAPFIVRGFFRLVRVMPVIEEKIRSELFIRSSGLEWTVLWPGFLTNFRMGEEPVVLPATARAPGLTSRQAAADVAVRCLLSDNAVGQVFIPVDGLVRRFIWHSKPVHLDVPWVEWTV
jgi:uncharacterized protein YbjT (DUF2867 family)